MKYYFRMTNSCLVLLRFNGNRNAGTTRAGSEFDTRMHFAYGQSNRHTNCLNVSVPFALFKILK